MKFFNERRETKGQVFLNVCVCEKRGQIKFYGSMGWHFRRILHSRVCQFYSFNEKFQFYSRFVFVFMVKYCNTC